MDYLNKQTPIKTSVVVIFCILFALGWFLYFDLVRKTLPNPNIIFSGTFFEIVGEVFKALFLGFTAGFCVNFYLKKVAPSETPISDIGIEKIYPHRLEAKEDLISIVRDNKVKKIYIAGMSLRDLLVNGALQDVWIEIRKRLLNEYTQIRRPQADKLKVFLLLLDPRSSEGRFRCMQEKRVPDRGLFEDVKHGLKEFITVENQIFSSQDQEFLQVKLYDHCPFAFIFATDSKGIFVEQYHYRPPKEDVFPVFPLIRYRENTQQYSEMFYSVETIWKNAHDQDLVDINLNDVACHPRVSYGIEKSSIKNIFRKEQRINELKDRQIECLQMVKNTENPIICILATSAKFYATSTLRNILKEIINESNCNGSVIKITMANPISQQAILRAIADESLPDEIGKKLKEWNWNNHSNSRLYKDIKATLSTIDKNFSNNNKIELKLYSSSISCAMLLTPLSAFVDLYNFGRSKASESGRVLGGEFPVFEFEPSEDKVEWELLQSHFDVVWKFYSISVTEYRAKNENDEFNKNLTRLLEELNV